MNVSAFYELRDRLNSCAAAGADTAGEDFRLKKAIDNFEPLSKTNKAFEKLFSLVKKISDDENPAFVLADSIALADALAITQGTFSDNSENDSLPEYDNINIVNAHYSVLSEMSDDIRKNGAEKTKVTEERKKLLSDPRIICEFLKYVDKQTGYLDDFAENLYMTMGKDLILLLKNHVDLSDPKASGNAVKYISDFTGHRENEWFLSLAKDENVPAKVRISAIKALGGSTENVPVLCELIKTEKGKIKSAALDSLLTTDCEEAEIEAKKLTENFKDSNASHIAAATGKTASDFVLSLIEQSFDEKGFVRRGISKYPAYFIEMLANKPFADKAFLKMANKENEQLLNHVLLENLTEHKNEAEKYTALIHRLYEKSEVFFLSEFYVDLIEDPETALDKTRSSAYKNKQDTDRIISGIYYNGFINKYCIDHRAGNVYSKYPVTVISVSFPMPLLEFICDEKNAGSFTFTALEGILSGCSDSDYERIRKYAKDFVFKCAVLQRNSSVLRMIENHYPHEAPENYKGFLAKYILGTDMRLFYPYRIDFLDDFPLSEEEKISEAKALLKKLEDCKGKIPIDEQRRQTQIRYIEEYLKNKS